MFFAFQVSVDLRFASVAKVCSPSQSAFAKDGNFKSVAPRCLGWGCQSRGIAIAQWVLVRG
jgi:hypothetical protein